jgi:hypothetical protein
VVVVDGERAGRLEVPLGAVEDGGVVEKSVTG